MSETTTAINVLLKNREGTPLIPYVNPDTELAADSEKPVQSKVVYEAIQALQQSMEAVGKRYLGEIFAYPGAVPPEGAYLLNGQTIAGCDELYPEFWAWLIDADIRKIDNDTFEAELASAGVCGGFVIDTAVGSVRLPDLRNGTLWGADSSNVGQSLAAGLPNITGAFGAASRSSGVEPSGGFSETKKVDPNIGFNVDANEKYDRGIEFDASASDSIYGNSNTVQPPAARVSFCIQVFNAATELSEQQSAQLASEMQTKAQTDLANTETLSASFLNKLMPDYNSGVAVTHPTSSAPFTAPCAGYFMECFYYGTTNSRLFINGVVSGVISVAGDSNRNNRQSTVVPLSAGDVVYWNTAATTIYGGTAFFYPVKGV